MPRLQDARPSPVQAQPHAVASAQRGGTTGSPAGRERRSRWATSGHPSARDPRWANGAPSPSCHTRRSPSGPLSSSTGSWGGYLCYRKQQLQLVKNRDLQAFCWYCVGRLACNDEALSKESRQLNLVLPGVGGVDLVDGVGEEDIRAAWRSVGAR